MLFDVSLSIFLDCNSSQFGGGLYSHSTRNSLSTLCFIDCYSHHPGAEDAGHSAYLMCKSISQTSDFNRSYVVRSTKEPTGRSSSVLFASTTQLFSKSNFSHNSMKPYEVVQSDSLNRNASCNIFSNCTSSPINSFLYYKGSWLLPLFV